MVLIFNLFTKSFSASRCCINLLTEGLGKTGFILLISFEKDSAEEKITLKPYKGKLGWIAMFGVAFAFFAHGGLLTFSERIGAGLDISVITMGNVFALGGLLTIVGPLIAGFIGSRFGSMKPSIFFLALMVIGSFFVANAWSPIIF